MSSLLLIRCNAKKLQTLLSVTANCFDSIKYTFQSCLYQRIQYLAKICLKFVILLIRWYSWFHQLVQYIHYHISCHLSKANSINIFPFPCWVFVLLWVDLRMDIGINVQTIPAQKTEDLQDWRLMRLKFHQTKSCMTEIKNRFTRPALVLKDSRLALAST